jgi:hypothetical protein
MEEEVTLVISSPLHAGITVGIMHLSIACPGWAKVGI